MLSFRFFSILSDGQSADDFNKKIRKLILENQTLRESQGISAKIIAEKTVSYQQNLAEKNFGAVISNFENLQNYNFFQM